MAGGPNVQPAGQPAAPVAAKQGGRELCSKADGCTDWSFAHTSQFCHPYEVDWTGEEKELPPAFVPWSSDNCRKRTVWIAEFVASALKVTDRDCLSRAKKDCVVCHRSPVGYKDYLPQNVAVCINGAVLLNNLWDKVQPSSEKIRFVFFAFPQPQPNFRLSQIDEALKATLSVLIRAAVDNVAKSAKPVVILNFVPLAGMFAHIADPSERKAYRALVKLRLLEELQQRRNVTAHLIGFSTAPFSNDVLGVFADWSQQLQWGYPSTLNELQYMHNVSYTDCDSCDLARSLAVAGNSVALAVPNEPAGGIASSFLMHEQIPPRLNREPTFTAWSGVAENIVRRTDLMPLILRLNGCRSSARAPQQLQQLIDHLQDLRQRAPDPGLRDPGSDTQYNDLYVHVSHLVMDVIAKPRGDIFQFAKELGIREIPV